MGAWGPGAFESDRALDWLGNSITDHLAREVARACEAFDADPQGSAEALRAAGKVLLALADADAYLDGPRHEYYSDVADRLRGPAMDPWLATWLQDATRTAVRRDLGEMADRLYDVAHGALAWREAQRQASA